MKTDECVCCLLQCYFSSDFVLFFPIRRKLDRATKVDDYLFTIYIIDNKGSQYGA